MTSSPKTPKKRRIKPVVRDVIIDKALEMIAQKGWRETTTEAVIAASGVTEQAFFSEFDGLLSVVVAGSRRVNAAMFEARADFDADESTRDRLFALVMARFDAGKPWHKAIGELNLAAPKDPVLAAAAGKVLMQGSALVLKSAGISTSGPLGFARINAFMVGVLWPAARVWLRDDSEDFATTMAELDQRLARAERVATWFGPKSGCGKPAEGETLSKQEA